MKKSKLKIVTAVLLVFILIGAVFIGIGAGTIIKDKIYMKNAESATALMSSIDFKNNTCVLWFSVDGEQYEPEYVFDSEKDDYAGKEVTVYYTKGSPDKIFVETDEIYYRLLYIGIAFMLVAAVLLGAVHIPLAVRRYIVKNGKTELVRIEKIVDVIGGQKLLCDSQKIRGKNSAPYKSKTIKDRISKDVINSAVTVYYLPKHKNLYYIDTKTVKLKENTK